MTKLTRQEIEKEREMFDLYIQTILPRKYCGRRSGKFYDYTMTESKWQTWLRGD